MKQTLFAALLVVQFLGTQVDLLAQAPPCGAVLAAYRGVPAKSNAAMGLRSCAGDRASDRGPYGWQYQCVEYVKRFYAEAMKI